jgi:hypothetical protein
VAGHGSCPADWSIVYFDEAVAAREKYQGPPSAYEVEIE